MCSFGLSWYIGIVGSGSQPEGTLEVVLGLLHANEMFKGNPNMVEWTCYFQPRDGGRKE